MTTRAPADPLTLEGFENLVGRHCSSSALRSVLAFDGLRLSEAVTFGLGGGLGFFYRREPGHRPSRRFNGRAPDLEGTFFRRVGRPIAWAGAWRPELLRDALARGRPLLAQTDIHPIPYYDDAHFTGHGLVVVGLDGGDVLTADIAADGFSRLPLEAFERAVAPEHPPLLAPYRYGEAPVVDAVDVLGLAPAAVRDTAEYMLEAPSADEGVTAMRHLAAELPGWSALPDLAWTARFGYQSIEKRGTGGGNFRFLFADFLDEVASALGGPAPVAGFRQAARGWQEVAAALKEVAFATGAPARREGLAQAARGVEALATLEEALFRELIDLTAPLVGKEK